MGIGAVGLLAGAGAAGLRVVPEPFPKFGADGPVTSVPLPAGLPAPVERWLAGHYGSQLPVIESVVVTGRARMRPFGVWLPARFRFIHDAGRGYRHYIEATWAGRPLLAVNERYLGGRALMELPVVGGSRGPELDQAANMGMWAELAMAAPAVLVTDPRVSWQSVDDQTALFVFPLADARDELVARFDPDSGALRSLEGWRHRSAGPGAAILWVAAVTPGPVIGPSRLPAIGTATWADQGEPWASFTTEELVVNADVSDHMRRRGL